MWILLIMNTKATFCTHNVSYNNNSDNNTGYCGYNIDFTKPTLSGGK